MRLAVSVFALALWLGGCVADTDEATLEAPPAAPDGMSAARPSEQSFDDSVLANRAALDKGKADGLSIVFDRQAPIAALDLSGLPRWTETQLLQGFVLVRDQRFIQGVPPAQLVRRPSFLYPDDGCFARARAMDYLLVQAGLRRPQSVFAFGTLTVQTPNTPLGQVTWWFHVAPVVAVGGLAYVLDPSLDPDQPLTLLEWVSLQSDPAQTGVSICSGHVFSPDGNCDQPALAESAVSIASEEYWYLIAEWNRQLELGRNAWSVLGDAPPWIFP